MEEYCGFAFRYQERIDRFTSKTVSLGVQID
jgi:hypothetical protein